ncbi:hypothetical protein ACOJBO_08485 [Rhizobium beringeri]
MNKSTKVTIDLDDVEGVIGTVLADDGIEFLPGCLRPFSARHQASPGIGQVYSSPDSFQ